MTSRLPLIAAVLSLSISGCAATTAGTAMPAGPVPLTTGQDLPAVLLSADDVGSLTGGKVVVTREVSAPWDDSAHVPVGTEPACLAIAGAAQRVVYADSGWTVLRGQVLREPPAAPVWSHFATQSVVLFPTAEAASDFYRRSVDGWTGCSGKEMTYSRQLAAQQSPAQVWSVAPASAERGMLTVSRSQRSPQQWSCQRALTTHANVAIDVEACRLDRPTDAAAGIAAAIRDRLPAA